MKKLLMTLAMAAAMVAAVSCACNNGSEKADGCAGTECADCAGCDKEADAVCDTGACDTECDKACDKACDKECDKDCEKQCDKKCDKHGEKKACCDSTKVDCKKAE